MKKPNIVRILEAIYLGILFITVILITLMHTIPSPALAAFRIPQNLREIGPELGLTWPLSLHVYHVFLFLYFMVILFNLLGLHFFVRTKLRIAAAISSFLGLFLIWSIFIFFLIPLIVGKNLQPSNINSSFIYAGFSFAFLILNIVTFSTIIESKTKSLSTDK